MFAMCWFLAFTTVTWFSGLRYRIYMGKCGFGSNVERLENVLAGVLVPSAPECRFYDNNTNLTAMNATGVFVPPSLATALEHFTFSLKSVWNSDLL